MAFTPPDFAASAGSDDAAGADAAAASDSVCGASALATSPCEAPALGYASPVRLAGFGWAAAPVEAAVPGAGFASSLKSPDFPFDGGLLSCALGFSPPATGFGAASGFGMLMYRYPSLNVFRRMAIALRVSTDAILFGADERGPDDALRYQFEAISRMPERVRELARELLDALIVRNQVAEKRKDKQ
ncbi:hypothetical protein [Burkholderia ubonensis]|uniref:hypothetical protein n=1 Tax=Burkholderia ubonensis TaxID=101571 RepID=UPI00210CE71E|nr:hypothetical protein [Burkholderia ubonensis]